MSIPGLYMIFASYGCNLVTSFVVLGMPVQYFYFEYSLRVSGHIQFGILFHIHMCGIFRNQIPLSVALFQCLHITIRLQIVLLANATILLSFISVAPNSSIIESTSIIVFTFGFKYAKHRFSWMEFFKFWKTFSCVSFQLQSVSFFSRDLSGAVLALNFGVKRT